MIRWEYRQFMFEPGDKLIDKLNQFGADGWEVFYFRDVGGGRTRALFKRSVSTPTTGDPQQ